jgi:hypothetical protein
VCVKRAEGKGVGESRAGRGGGACLLSGFSSAQNNLKSRSRWGVPARSRASRSTPCHRNGLGDRTTPKRKTGEAWPETRPPHLPGRLTISAACADVTLVIPRVAHPGGRPLTARPTSQTELAPIKNKPGDRSLQTCRLTRRGETPLLFRTGRFHKPVPLLETKTC